MTKTLILLFHRSLSESTANAALVDVASTIDGAEVIDMQSRYPDGSIDMFTDAKDDAQLLLNADRIVLQFPIQWYATPSLLKAWQDAVLTRMYYLFPETKGDRLTGTPLMVAVTAGNVPGAYTRGGQNFYSVDELLTPLKATAYRCGLPWHDPYIVYNADKLDGDMLSAARNGYATALSRFANTDASQVA